VMVAVAVIITSILLFFSSFLFGFVFLLVGILIVGKKCACMYTHTQAHTHTYIHPSMLMYIHLTQE
jgi:hypothetical protein